MIDLIIKVILSHSRKYNEIKWEKKSPTIPNPKTATFSFAPQKYVSACGGDGAGKGAAADPRAPLIPSFSNHTLTGLTNLYLRSRVSGEADSRPNSRWITIHLSQSQWSHFPDNDGFRHRLMCNVGPWTQRRWLDGIYLWGFGERVFSLIRVIPGKKQSSSKKLSHTYFWHLTLWQPSCNHKTKERHILHLQPFPTDLNFKYIHTQTPPSWPNLSLLKSLLSTKELSKQAVSSTKSFITDIPHFPISQKSGFSYSMVPGHTLHVAITAINTCSSNGLLVYSTVCPEKLSIANIYKSPCHIKA